MPTIMKSVFATTWLTILYFSAVGIVAQTTRPHDDGRDEGCDPELRLPANCLCGLESLRCLFGELSAIPRTIPGNAVSL